MSGRQITVKGAGWFCMCALVAASWLLALPGRSAACRSGTSAVSANVPEQTRMTVETGRLVPVGTEGDFRLEVAPGTTSVSLQVEAGAAVTKLRVNQTYILDCDRPITRRLSTPFGRSIFAIYEVGPEGAVTRLIRLDRNPATRTDAEPDLFVDVGDPLGDPNRSGVGPDWVNVQTFTPSVTGRICRVRLFL